MLLWICALLIGLSLGLLGSGGSILTIPVLVYVAHTNPALAINYSLFIVGLTAAVGTIRFAITRELQIKETLFFASASVSTVFIVRGFLVPLLPAEIIIANYTIQVESLLMLLLVVVMLFSAKAMIAEVKFIQQDTQQSKAKVIANGTAVGAITGVTGAGGGFLIVPSLIINLRFSFLQATASSLFIVFLNSAIGFLTGYKNFKTYDWSFLILFALVSITGLFIGTFIKNKFNLILLRKFFGYFIIAVAIYIILKEIWL